MTAKEFFENVKTMRRWQREWFTHHDSLSLRKAMYFEKIIDAEIERVAKVTDDGGNLPNQLNLDI